MMGVDATMLTRALVLEPIQTRKGTLEAGMVIDVSQEAVRRLQKKIRLVKPEKSKDRAKIINGELICLFPVDDLATVIVGLTENNLPLQKQLLLKYCQQYDPATHFWHQKEKWEEKAAILEYDAGLTRDDAEIKAAEMYHLLAFMDELKAQEITTPNGAD